MPYCEDYPACGHELGCCPDYDPETGAQLNMKCVCGATLPITRSLSICDGCLRPPPHECSPSELDEYYGHDEDDEEGDDAP